MPELKYLSATEILAKDDFKYEDVDMTEEWGGFVRIRDLSALDRQEFLADVDVDDEGNVKDFRALLGQMPAMIARVAVNPDTRKLLFTPAQVEELKKKNAKAIQKLFREVVKLAGLSAEAIDDAGKGSGETPSSDSSTGSPSPSVSRPRAVS